jgi:hypothetical protein
MRPAAPGLFFYNLFDISRLAIFFGLLVYSDGRLRIIQLKK